MVKFKFQGKIIRKSTKTGDLQLARQVEARIKSELVRGEWGILHKPPPVETANFCRDSFIPSLHSSRLRPATNRYYRYGVQLIQRSILAHLPLGEITGKEIHHFCADLQHLSPSTVNCGIRTLRKILSFAKEVGVIEDIPRVRAVPGEKQRKRVLSADEEVTYLSACKQPWKDVAAIILATGMRPGEVFCLRGEYVDLVEKTMEIPWGKSDASRRVLPIPPSILPILQRRYRTYGWLFSQPNKFGHVSRDTVKRQHSAACRSAKIQYFPPYTLRHTAATRISKGTDPFTTAAILGHSSLTITKRYTHPHLSRMREVMK